MTAAISSENWQQIISDMAVRIAELEATVTTAPRRLQSGFNDGDTAWMLTSCALVLFMTIPGLALYYAGMVSFIFLPYFLFHDLSIVLQGFVITALITFLLLCFVGYSLAFPLVGKTGSQYSLFGNSSRFWLTGMTKNFYQQNDPQGGFFIGFFTGPFCYFGVKFMRLIQHLQNYDDALDAFGIHATACVWGTIMTGFFATYSVDDESDGDIYAGDVYAGRHARGT